jgi:hypothetical protein
MEENPVLYVTLTLAALRVLRNADGGSLTASVVRGGDSFRKSVTSCLLRRLIFFLRENSFIVLFPAWWKKEMVSQK